MDVVPSALMTPFYPLICHALSVDKSHDWVPSSVCNVLFIALPYVLVYSSCHFMSTLGIRRNVMSCDLVQNFSSFCSICTTVMWLCANKLPAIYCLVLAVISTVYISFEVRSAYFRLQQLLIASSDIIDQEFLCTWLWSAFNLHCSHVIL